MNISCVKAVYYSAVGTTEKVVTGVAEKIAEALGVPMEVYDFTLPENRTDPTAGFRCRGRWRRRPLRRPDPESP